MDYIPRMPFGVLIATVSNHLPGKREQLIPSGQQGWNVFANLSCRLVN